MALWVHIMILLYTLQIHNNTTIDNMNIIIIIISSQYEINNEKNLERGHKKKKKYKYELCRGGSRCRRGSLMKRDIACMCIFLYPSRFVCLF